MNVSWQPNQTMSGCVYDVSESVVCETLEFRRFNGLVIMKEKKTGGKFLGNKRPRLRTKKSW